MASDLVYNMAHKKRGYFVVISNENFKGGHLNKRKGTENDAASLEKAFTRLGFKVTIHKDLKKDAMLEEIIKVSRLDHKDCDCLAIAILSHGSQEEGKDVLFGSDGQSIKLEDLMEPLKVQGSLVGKPKLIIMQACRGTKLDEGFLVESDGFQTDSTLQWECDSIEPVTKLIPIESDFLYYYSTASGYFAWKSPKGSVCIQSLCDIIEENLDGKWSINDLLTFVNNRVGKYQSNCPNDPSMHGMKEQPVIQSQLSKLLYFTPKNVA